MGGVKNNRLIHAGLDPRAKFFHKTGDIGHMLGDAGIVVTPEGKNILFVFWPEDLIIILPVKNLR